MNNKPGLIPILEAIFTVVVWGGTFIATKVVLQEVSPATVVWVRFAMGVLILGCAVLIRKQFALPEGKEWAYFALLGFIVFCSVLFCFVGLIILFIYFSVKYFTIIFYYLIQILLF